MSIITAKTPWKNHLGDVPMHLDYFEGTMFEALEKIADLTVERKTGARGLRSIIEGILQDIMFETPSDPDIKRVIITGDTVNGGKAVIEK